MVTMGIAPIKSSLLLLLCVCVSVKITVCVVIVGNGCDSLKLHCDPLGFQQPLAKSESLVAGTPGLTFVVDRAGRTNCLPIGLPKPYSVINTYTSHSYNNYIAEALVYNCKLSVLI